jgi:hypothetical protein
MLPNQDPSPKTQVPHLQKVQKKEFAHENDKQLKFPNQDPSPKTKGLHLRKVQKMEFAHEKANRLDSLTKTKAPRPKTSIYEKCKNRVLMTKNKLPRFPNQDPIPPPHINY